MDRERGTTNTCTCTDFDANVKDYFKKMGRAKRAGIALCSFALLIIAFFFIIGVASVTKHSYCDALYFGPKELNTITLPDLRNLSLSDRRALLAGTYDLFSEYNLQLIQDSLGIVSLCVLKRSFTRVSACVKIGTDMELQFHIICGPDMRPDCLPSAILEHYIGLSLWYREESVVLYAILDIDSSAMRVKNLTSTTSTLSAVWYDVLDCQFMVDLTIAVIILGGLLFICCLGFVGCCLWGGCVHYRKKRQLRRPEHDEDLTLSDLVENEGSSSEPVVEGNDEETESLGPSELVYQDGLSAAACQDVSSSDEENVQAQLLPADRVASRESVRTAVSERGHRRHGRRNRFVPTNRPTVGYFTDSTSMSGAPTDVSTNDASDEDSNEDVHAQLSSSSSSVAVLVQEATRVDTPPLFARLHPTTVYDHRPGVTTEPRQPPDGT